MQQPFQAAQPAQASVATVCTHVLTLFISFITLDNNLEHKTDVLKFSLETFLDYTISFSDLKKNHTVEVF